ncbi:hypothetical protein RM704_34525 [Streptomyces sp. DSM 3412]|uniref:Integral membrane protein n=1 Tax=Streptomyces gottesmaniae TaxID=3075518 RepID=A0ABU2Z835_9ACTN|nr:hypothetical protein [Streptomyces sp. DSM 3412]MDT0572520.1 hypothetical protein [Streptomyces sp. DSM 3412]
MTNGEALDGADGTKRPRGGVVAVVLLWIASHLRRRAPTPAPETPSPADGPARQGHAAQLPRPPEEMFRGHRTAWRERAVARILFLEQQAACERCRAVEDPAERCQREETLAGIARHLEEARHAVSARRRLFTGAAALERTWANVRAADVMLLALCSDQDLVGRSADVLSHVEQHLRPNDTLRVKVAAAAGRVEAAERLPGDRELLVSGLSASYEALDGEFSRVRSLSIILRIATFFVLLGAGGLAVWGWACPDSLNMCFLPEKSEYAACPSGEIERNDAELAPSDYAQRVDVLVVEAAGLAGAALTVIASLRRIQGTSSPYMLPLAAALLKFPTGALTAFVGVLLIRGAFIPGLSYLDSSPQIVAWAVIFGAAQHLVTRFVDARARETLSDVGRPPTDPPERRAADGGQSLG